MFNHSSVQDAGACEEEEKHTLSYINIHADFSNYVVRSVCSSHCAEEVFLTHRLLWWLSDEASTWRQTPAAGFLE